MNWNPNQNKPSLTNTNKVKRLQSIQKIDTPQNLVKKSNCGLSFCFIFSCCSFFQILNNTKIRNSVNIDPPSIEEIRTWSESFDRLMKNQSGRKYFRDFLRSEYSEENMLFWMACEELKTEQNQKIFDEKARSIYHKYISILSPKEVNIDNTVRDEINRNMVDPSPYIFNEAQLQIYKLMHRDSFRRFLNSPIYKKLCDSDTKL